MAYVMFHEEDGIFLGICFGLAFWSKIDPVGQPAAATFKSPEEALEFMGTWNDGPREGVRFVGVVADVDGTHASIASCVRAGLPGWMDEFVPALNKVPI